MADPIMASMSALNLSWDTPYRLLASILSVGCACVLWGWLDASTPFEALGQIGEALGVHPAPEIAQKISDWLTMRQSVIVHVATLLFLAGVIFNVGDGTGRSTIPGAWRGATTALIALAIIWQVDPGELPSTMILTAVSLGLLLVLTVFKGRRHEIQPWIGSTIINLASSAAFLLVLPAWPLSRTSPKARQS